jgi:plastocyanin
VTIDASYFSFSPSTLTIKRANNTKITMTNSGSAPHQLKVYRDDAYPDAVPGAETQRVAGGASDDFTILSTDIGSGDELYFRCEIHPSQMKGEITVQ